jgi:hypothetical protein
MWQPLPNVGNEASSGEQSASNDDVARELPLAFDVLSENVLELTAVSNHSNTFWGDVPADGMTTIFDFNVADVISEINGIHESNSAPQFDTDESLLELNVENPSPILPRSEHFLHSNVSASESNDFLHVFADMNINCDTPNSNLLENNSQTVAPREDTEIEQLSPSQPPNAVPIIKFQSQLPGLHHLRPTLFCQNERPDGHLQIGDVSPPQANEVAKPYLPF